MKYVYFLVLAWLGAIQAEAQYVVIDPTEISVLENSNVSQLQQWASQLAKMDSQFQQLTQQLQQLQNLNQVIGNPASIAGSIVTGPINSVISKSALSQTLQSLEQAADGAKSFQADPQGLYQQITTTTPAGNTYTPNYAEFKPNAALQGAQQNFISVVQMNVPQMQQLMAEIQSLQNQAQAATTQSEVQKVQAQLQTAQTAYSNLQGQVTTAAQQVVAQKSANDSNQQTQDQANAEKFMTDVNQEMQQLSVKIQPTQLQP